MTAKLKQILDSPRLDTPNISQRTEGIYRELMNGSRYINNGNFTVVHDRDVAEMFDAYDREFFDGELRNALGVSTLDLRFSKRLTKSGGVTKRFRATKRSRIEGVRYEIAISSTLLFQSFQQDDRPITVNGLLCQDRLQAMQRVMEHEIVHLAEMLVWTNSSCSKSRFQNIATRTFGHTEYTHGLITQAERAKTHFGVRPGGKVKFEFEGRQYVGMVNRITRRATVLVEDAKGEQYSDGKRYAKYYIPLGMLTPVK